MAPSKPALIAPRLSQCPRSSIARWTDRRVPVGRVTIAESIDACKVVPRSVSAAAALLDAYAATGLGGYARRGRCNAAHVITPSLKSRTERVFTIVSIISSFQIRSRMAQSEFGNLSIYAQPRQACPERSTEIMQSEIHAGTLYKTWRSLARPRLRALILPIHDL